jgi:hypothetical protein
LNDHTVRIGAVKGRASVSMYLKRINDRHAARAEVNLEIPHPLDAFDHEAEMIEFAVASTSFDLGHFMYGNVVAARGKINV